MKILQVKLVFSGLPTNLTDIYVTENGILVLTIAMLKLLYYCVFVWLVGWQADYAHDTHRVDRMPVACIQFCLYSETCL